jgi:predicted lipid-binding transport protein (Tim44 family)
MNRKIGMLLSLFIAMSLMLSGIHEAQARRLGGGSSFGGKPSYSAPFERPAAPNNFSQPSRSPSQQQAATQNQTARQGLASRGGIMGMLGGLALGGLLGSLFFGGAFENINFMDILLFAGIAYLVYRLFAARSARQNQAAANAYARGSHQDTGAYQSGEPMGVSSGRFDTDLLFSKDKNNLRQLTGNIPKDFDQQAFLSGAERAFRHLQAAWDNRDLAAIRGLSTDKVFAEIQDQMRASNSANKTEVLQLHAELLDVREVGGELEATVLFAGLMREDDAQAESVKEVWHFIKPVNSMQSKWFLDGIQQLAE